MGESATRSVRLWAKDGYVLSLGTLLLLAALFDYLVGFPTPAERQYVLFCSLFPFVFIIFLATVSAWRKAARREERLFWTWLLTSDSFFFVTLIAYTFFRHDADVGVGNIVVSAFALLSLLCIFIAVEQRPDRQRETEEQTSSGGIRIVSYLFLGFVLLLYFQFIPSRLSPVPVPTWLPPWAPYVLLDLALSARFLWMSFSCSSRRWRYGYRLMSACFLLWAVADGSSLLVDLHILSNIPNVWMGVLFHIPFVPFLLAVRLTDSERAVQEPPGLPFRASITDKITLVPSSFLLFFLPAMHIGLSTLNPAPEPIQAARRALVLAALPVLYVMTWGERRIQKRQHTATDKRRRESEQVFESLFENAPDACYLIDLMGNFVLGNRAAEKMIGYSREELIGRNFATSGLLSTPHVCRAISLLGRNVLGAHVQNEEFVLNRKDGTQIETEIRSFPVELGSRTLVLGIARDITERKRMEGEILTHNELLEARLAGQTAELRKAEARFRGLVEQSLVGIYLVEGSEARVTYANPRAAEIFGYTPAEIVGKRAVDFAVEDDRGRMMENIRARMEGTATSVRYTYRGRHKSGALLDIEVHGTRSDFNGQPAILGVIMDVTESKRAEKALREAEEKYREIFDHAVVGIFQTTPEGRYLSANYEIARMYGYDSPEDLMTTVTDIEHQEYVDPNKRRELIDLLEKNGVLRNAVFEVFRKDGSHAWVSENSRAVRDATGKITHLEGTQEDVTDRKRLEEQLLQAQKLEAIGHLAGGIAHDFNNILNIVMGYSQLLLSTQNSPSMMEKGLTSILETTKRGASLTQQLLAFSRKQILQLQVIDLNQSLTGVREMLSRVIGEDIELITSTLVSTAPIKADPNQIERMLVNLAINSREAMPQGGRLIMEITSVENEELNLVPEVSRESGSHVQLTVTDTGCGMDPETISHIFEPFFTTKQRANGTGLGLAQVYGIVKQCDGTISVMSAPGKGTTFSICFPIVEGVAGFPQPLRTDSVINGNETVLLVEDEAQFREVVCTFLEGIGYKVLEAANPSRALQISRIFRDNIDLLLTDVIMPGMNGRQLADILVAERPQIKVVYMSGYSDDKIARTGVPDFDITLLQKPFTLEKLALRIRQTLEAGVSASPAASTASVDQ